MSKRQSDLGAGTLLRAASDADNDNVTSAIRRCLKAGMVERPAFSVWGRDIAP